MSAAGGMIREVAGLSSGPDRSSLTYSQQTRVSGCWTTWERRAGDGGSAGAGEREAASVMTAQPGGTGFQVTPAASDRQERSIRSRSGPILGGRSETCRVRMGGERKRNGGGKTRVGGVSREDGSSCDWVADSATRDTPRK